MRICATNDLPFSSSFSFSKMQPKRKKINRICVMCIHIVQSKLHAILCRLSKRIYSECSYVSFGHKNKILLLHTYNIASHTYSYSQQSRKKKYKTVQDQILQIDDDDVAQSGLRCHRSTNEITLTVKIKCACQIHFVNQMNKYSIFAYAEMLNVLYQHMDNNIYTQFCFSHSHA